ncbi:SDR family NAD(P)-dependent oxidoreductase [bacterium]|nr:SDR family NAD(P)-dependent oxidoreductase [bacterium]
MTPTSRPLEQIPFQNLVEVLRFRAQQQPERMAIKFLTDGEEAHTSWTYEQLQRRSMQIANHLCRHAEPGDRVLLVFPPGLDYIAAFYGCLYAGLIAVPTYAARLTRSSSKLLSVLEDSQARVVLTTARLMEGLPADLAEVVHGTHWMAVEDVPASASDSFDCPEITRDDVAFLQYTSGSTAAPRGVMVTHGNLLHNQSVIAEKFQSTADSVGVIWLPPYHDMGLIGGILQPVYSGMPVILMPPLSFIQRPFRWLKAISDHRASASGGPNFAYDLCVERISPEQRATLDLSSWKVAFNGAEPIRSESLHRFAETFAECGFRREAFYPCYGLAESTLLVTGADCQQGAIEATIDPVRLEQAEAVADHSPSARRLVASGTAARGQSVIIVDRATGGPAPEGRVGEIYISGPSVAKGYWNRPEETRETFEARVVGQEDLFLRTGDLGFFAEGQLYVTGRQKDLIIVRGSNHYPQDIEATATQSHDSLKGGRGAAFSVDGTDQERLVLVHEVTSRDASQFDEILTAITRAIALEHELQVSEIVLVGQHRVPKTSSGKIQRRACREQFLKGELSGVLASWKTGQAPTSLRDSRLSLPAGEKSDVLGADFYRFVLDPDYLVDSAALWEGADQLSGAQTNKFVRLAELSDLRPDTDVLDVGCGWGGFLKYAVDSLGSRSVVGLTLSPEEAAHAGSLMGPRGKVLVSSWSDFSADQSFDSVVCAGAIEHFVTLADRARGEAVKRYRSFFKRARRWMRGTGRLAIETLISVRRADSPQAYQDVSTLAKMFPHSSIPSIDDLRDACEGLFDLVESDSIRRDYQRTLVAWLGRLHEHRSEILEKFGMETFEKFDRYFEASLRQAKEGYVDLIMLSLQPLNVSPEMLEEDADSRVTRSPLSARSATRSMVEIQEWITQSLARKLRVETSDIDARQPFSTFGLDSLAMVSLVGELETWLEQSLSPTLAWDYPSIETLSAFLAGETTGDRQSEEPAALAEPIAIIGMGCRFPGAHSLDEYWNLMMDRVDAIQEIPKDRWNIDEYFDKDPDSPGKMVTRWGGFVDRIDQFDPQFFGISPREAARMDPQQRMLLETTWEALEHAGLPSDRVAGSRTGVFVGIGGTDYSQLYRRFDNPTEYLDAYCGTGNALSIAANRLSYIFDLRGPSLSVDTACSSALVAIHYAAQSLRQRDCDMAIAGGVNAILTPEVTIAFSKARMLSPDGRCKTFDADANGYVRGEGCGVVIFKRLADAVRDGDPVLAILRSTAVNQDGKTTGITAPNGPAQKECVRTALEQAGVKANELTYIEAHGTGTPLGDPIEVNALRDVVAGRPESEPVCYLGSIKANIGHLETASGVAGLIRVVLMMKHGIIPPQRNFQKLNPHIKLEGSPLRITTEPVRWTGLADHRRFAGVSGFGFGGTNAHLILEAPRFSADLEENENEIPERPQHVVVWSAQSENALRDYAANFLALLDAQPEATAADWAWSTARLRTPFDFRATAIVESINDLRDQWTSFVETGRSPNVVTGPVRVRSKPKMAMLFTGQGSQYAGMAKDLFETEPVFRSYLEESARLLAGRLPRPLLDVLFDADSNDVNETTYTQPALFAVEYSLAKLWQSWGIEPTSLLGHSVGEIAAATFAEVMSLEDGLALIAKRAELMGKLPTGGKMAVIFASEADVLRSIAALNEGEPRRGSARVDIAAINGPENTVVSGPEQAVDELLARFAEGDVRTQELVVSHAFHSSLLEPMLDEFERFAQTISYRPARIPLVSNVTGAFFAEGEAPDARYWRRHARGAVRFADGMLALSKSRVDVYLEVGPHPSLVAMGRRCVKPGKQLWCGSLRRGSVDSTVMAQTISSLFIHGTPIDVARRDAGRPRRRLELPTYPFQRQRFWMEEDADKKSTRWLATSDATAHPLLGSPVPLAMATHVFAGELSTRRVPSLAHHVVQGSIVLPGAAYLETALAAAHAVFGPGVHRVENINFQQALFLPEGRRQAIQVVVSPEVAGTSTFQFLSLPADAPAGTSWTTHSAGVLARVTSADPVQAVREIPTHVRDEVDIYHDRADLYTKLRDRGMEYGELFQVSQEIWKKGQETLSRLALPEALKDELTKFQLHPAIMDACIQMLGATIPEELVASGTGETYLPTGVAQLRLFSSPQPQMWVHAKLHTDFAKEGLRLAQGDIYLLDDAGRVIAEFLGVTLTRIGARHSGAEVHTSEQWVHSVVWNESSLAGDQELSRGPWVLLGDNQGVTMSMASLLSQRGIKPIVAVPGREFARTNSGYRLRWNNPADYRKLVEAVGPSRFVHAWSLRSDRGATKQEEVRSSTLSLLYLVQAIDQPTSELFVVTRGSQSVLIEDDTDPAATAVWGLARVVANERLDLPTRLIDLDPAADEGVNASSLLAELGSNAGEREVSYRGEQRRVPRLRREGSLIRQDAKEENRSHTTLPASGAYRLEVGATPTLDRLAYRSFARSAPGEGEIEIEVAATGLNFSDVLKAMGLYPGLKPGAVPIGIECSGRVVAKSPTVKEFEIGDEVVGIAPFSFASHTTTSAMGVVRKPASISHEEAAAVPIAYLTAHYALRWLARVEPGERVLIHAAAGGVGLAAIQICQAIGAEVFATAGSDEKRDYLRSLGVKHIFNSRSLDFADQIREVTQGKGVDVVLNSLPGEAITKSIESLGAYGRFLEIGKTDIYQNKAIGLYPFQNNLSYFAIDLDKMMREKPTQVRKMFLEVVDLFDRGMYRPLPMTTFAAEQTSSAFRYMAQRKNIGKVVVSYARSTSSPEAAGMIRADGAYWITGGLGALGLEIAQWLSQLGARQLVLFGRSAPSPSAEEVLARLRRDGVQSTIVMADVGDRESLQQSVAKLPSLLARPIGVFHVAGVLDDGVLAQQNRDRFEKVLRSKVDGGWNLHEITLDAPLDHFVLFSSVASLLGSPGQANYAAGNAFLDGLAQHRRSMGLPALSINWGPWAEVGMAARLGEDKLTARGIAPMKPAQAIEVLEKLLETFATQVTVADIDWPTMLALYPDGPPAMFSELAGQASKKAEGDDELRQRLLDTPHEDRLEMLQSYFVDQIARVMELDAARINPEQPMNTLGLDSLMAIELKNGIESSLGVNIPMAKFLEGPSAHQLSRIVLELMTARMPAPGSDSAGGGNEK